MTDPTGGAPAPQGPGNWQTPPPAPAPGGFDPSNFQQAAVEPGPAPGVAYADLVSRIIAMVIDGFILAIAYVVLSIIGGIFTFGNLGLALLMGLVFGVIWAAATAAYCVYTWTRMRATYGQKFLKLETVNAADGATLTQNQAIKRWAYLWGPSAVGFIIPILGILILMVASLYQLYLLYTASQSPKRQGFHDVQAGTVVVKRLA
jgi:uncharacterized RDD family membrane protein YckC